MNLAALTGSFVCQIEHREYISIDHPGLVARGERDAVTLLSGKSGLVCSFVADGSDSSPLRGHSRPDELCVDLHGWRGAVQYMLL